MEKNKAFRKVPREFSHLCRISKCLCHWIIKSYQVQSSDSPVEIPVSPKQFYWPCVKVIEEVCLIDLRQPSTASAYFPWAALCWWDPPSSILHPQNGGNGRSQCTVIFCLSNPMTAGTAVSLRTSSMSRGRCRRPYECHEVSARCDIHRSKRDAPSRQCRRTDHYTG